MEIQIGHNVFDGNPNTQMMWGMQPPLPTYYTCSSDMWNKNHLVIECVEQGMNQLLCDEHLSQQQYKLNVWINRVYAIRIATAFWAEQPNILSQMRYCATNKSAFYSAIAEKWHSIVKTIFTWFRTKATILPRWRLNSPLQIGMISSNATQVSHTKDAWFTLA